MEKIYITGMGLVSCQGSGIEEFWTNICSIEKHNEYDLKLPLDIPKIPSNNTLRRMDRFAKLTTVASTNAFKDSSLNDKEYNPYRVGTVFNTIYGPLNSCISFASKLISDGVDMVSPNVFTSTVTNSGLGYACMNLKLKGASTMLSGSNSIGCACDLIKWGRADAIFVGGIEEYAPDLFEGFNQKEYTTMDNKFICRPMDKSRNGTRMSECSAVMTLERENAPFFNPDKVICEVLGYGNALSYSKTGIALEPVDDEPFINAMKAALEDAQVKSDKIDGVFMAANGSRFTDRAEAKAIHAVFGQTSSSIPVTSIKGAVGETLGASLSINVIAAAVGMKKGMIPPTIGCEEPDEKIGLNIIYKEVIQGEFNCFMVNGYDISSGGIYSVILGRK